MSPHPEQISDTNRRYLVVIIPIILFRRMNAKPVSPFKEILSVVVQFIILLQIIRLWSIWVAAAAEKKHHTDTW